MRAGLTVAAFSLLGGCAEYHAARFQLGTTNTLLTRADLRVVMERPDPHAGGGAAGNVVCSEPPPDIALAANQSLDVQAKTHGLGAGVGYGTSEAALALAGRTAAVVALRDGLFRACEAYSNNVIGRSEYAMILSQYGDLLVTLVLGDASEAAASVNTVKADIVPHLGAPADPAAAQSAPSTPGASPGTTTTTTTTAPATPAAPTSLVPTPVDQFALRPASLMVAATPAAKPTQTAAASAKETPTASPAASAQQPVPSSPASGTTGPSAIAKLYFDHADERMLKALFVMCVSEAAHARERGPGQTHAPDFIDAACQTNAYHAFAAKVYDPGAAAPPPAGVSGAKAALGDTRRKTSRGAK